MTRADPLFDGLRIALRTNRARLGISQETAARRAGINRNHWGVIERAEARPGVEALARIADALGISLPDLLQEAIDLAPDAVARETEDARTTTP